MVPVPSSARCLRPLGRLYFTLPLSWPFLHLSTAPLSYSTLSSRHIIHTMRLLLFSGSQSPLAVRYPHPDKPVLALPPLVHRALHTALDAQPPSALIDTASDTLVIPNPAALTKQTTTPLGEDTEYEVTVKIQLLAAVPPASYVHAVKEALQTLSDRKGLSRATVVLVGLPDGTSGEPSSCTCLFSDVLSHQMPSGPASGKLSPTFPASNNGARSISTSSSWPN